jgi:hypothetical protein
MTAYTMTAYTMTAYTMTAYTLTAYTVCLRVYLITRLLYAYHQRKMFGLRNDPCLSAWITARPVLIHVDYSPVQVCYEEDTVRGLTLGARDALREKNRTTVVSF